MRVRTKILWIITKRSKVLVWLKKRGDNGKFMARLRERKTQGPNVKGLKHYKAQLFMGLWLINGKDKKCVNSVQCCDTYYD